MLDEYILGGEVQETSKREMLDRIRELEKLEWVVLHSPNELHLFECFN